MTSDEKFVDLILSSSLIGVSPLCPRPIVLKSHCTPNPDPFRPFVPPSHCVPMPTPFRPIVPPSHCRVRQELGLGTRAQELGLGTGAHGTGACEDGSRRLFRGARPLLRVGSFCVGLQDC